MKRSEALEAYNKLIAKYHSDRRIRSLAKAMPNEHIRRLEENYEECVEYYKQNLIHLVYSEKITDNADISLCDTLVKYFNESKLKSEQKFTKGRCHFYMENANENSLVSLKEVKELIDILKENSMQRKAGQVFEVCDYLDTLQGQLETMTKEITSVRQQLSNMKEELLLQTIGEAQRRLEENHENSKKGLAEIKKHIVKKSAEIVKDTKQNGKKALRKISEVLKIKEELKKFNEYNRECSKEIDEMLERVDQYAKGMQEAEHIRKNSFRILMGKEPVKNISENKEKAALLRTPLKLCKRITRAIDVHTEAALNKITEMENTEDIDKTEKVEAVKTEEQNWERPNYNDYEHTKIFDRMINQQSEELELGVGVEI